MPRTPLLRDSTDVRPVAWVLLAAMLSLLPLVLRQLLPAGLPPTVWALSVLWLVSLYARTRAPYAQHNHAHLSVFRSRGWNIAYDAVLTLVTGYPTALWALHHNLGHHRSFLTPAEDVASIVHPRTGRPYSRLWYTLRGNATIHRDALRIARREAARGKPRLLRKLKLELALQVAVIAGLCAWNTGLTVLFVVIPNLFAAALVWWESYVHHLGVPMTDVYDGAVTTTGRRFNRKNFNIGHHTAHHEKPTLHWSLLPARTEIIRAKIPQVCWRGETPGPGGLVSRERPDAETVAAESLPA